MPAVLRRPAAKRSLLEAGLGDMAEPRRSARLRAASSSAAQPALPGPAAAAAPAGAGDASSA
eukprot:13420869-Alexandrium_andersonii.AAC.1